MSEDNLKGLYAYADKPKPFFENLSENSTTSESRSMSDLARPFDELKIHVATIQNPKSEATSPVTRITMEFSGSSRSSNLAQVGLRITQRATTLARKQYPKLDVAQLRDWVCAVLGEANKDRVQAYVQLVANGSRHSVGAGSLSPFICWLAHHYQLSWEEYRLFGLAAIRLWLQVGLAILGVDRMEVLGLDSGRHEAWYSRCLSALARASSLAHTRLIGLGLIVTYLPSVSAASITQAADYVQGQIGANAVVLAFGALAGSGQAVMLEEGLGAGPLAGVNKAIALITRKTRFSEFDQRAGFNLRDKERVHIPTLMRSILLPQLSAWGIQTAAWAWCLVRSASPSTTAGHGLAVATYYLFLPYCTLWLYRFWEKGDPKVIVWSHWYEDPDSLVVEGRERVSSKLLAQMRDRRDHPIVVHEAHVQVRPVGDALQTELNLWRCTTGTNVQFERKRNYLMRAVFLMLESIGILWWVYTMALPGLDGGAWWPVLVMFIAAVFLDTQSKTSGPVTHWLGGDEYSQLERYLQRVAVWRYLPSAYVSDLRTDVTAQSVLATALLSGTLEDGWSTGPKVQLAEHLADDIYEVWWLCVEVDHTKLAHTGLTRRDKAKAISCSADMVEVARRLINLSGHAATCANVEKYIKRPDVGRLSTRAWLAWVDTHHKKCGAAVEDANWLADWVERNFWFLACHPGVQILPSPQSEQGKRITAAPTWRECARRALCSIYYPDDTEDMLHLAPLFIMGMLDENCIGIFEPAACVWAAWCDGLNVQVSGAYGCITLRVGNRSCTSRSGSPIAEYPLELAKLGEVSRQWHTALERLKLRVGDSTALVPYSGLLNFAWAGNTADDVAWDDVKGLTTRKTQKWSELSLSRNLW